MPLLSTAPGASRNRLALVLPAVAIAVASVAGCGGGSSSGAAVAAGTSATAGTTGGPNGFAAYAACLKKNGVTLPTGRPGGGFGGSRPSGGARPSGRPGGGFGGLNATSGPMAAAAKACASLRPTGGFGGGANSAAIQSQLLAYRSCLSDHGVTLPTQAARPTGTPAAGATGTPGRRGGFGGLGALNTDDPKVAAAVKACAPLRPTFGGGAPGAGAATPTPSATPNA